MRQVASNREEGGKQSQKLRVEGGFERGYYLSAKQFLPNLRRREEISIPDVPFNTNMPPKHI